MPHAHQRRILNWAHTVQVLVPKAVNIERWGQHIPVAIWPNVVTANTIMNFWPTYWSISLIDSPWNVIPMCTLVALGSYIGMMQVDMQSIHLPVPAVCRQSNSVQKVTHFDASKSVSSALVTSLLLPCSVRRLGHLSRSGSICMMRRARL
jgi:hypothetical protein